MANGANNYNQGGGKSPIPLIIGILVIIFLGVYYIYKEPIDKKISSWKKDFENTFEKKIEPTLTPYTGITDNQEDSLTITPDYISPDYEEASPQQNTESTQSEVIVSTNEIGIEKSVVTNTKSKNEDKKTTLPKTEKKAPLNLKPFKGKNGKYGFMNASNEEILIEAQYDEYVRFENKNPSYIAVRKGERYGIINLENRIILPFIYNGIYQTNGFWELKKNSGSRSLYGLARISDAKVILPAEYEDIRFINSSFILVKKNGLYGCVNNNGEITVTLKYKGVEGYSYGGGNSNKARVDLIDEGGNTISFNKSGQIVYN